MDQPEDAAAVADGVVGTGEWADWAAAGLYDAAHPQAAQRRDLLGWLEVQGLRAEDFAGVTYDEVVVLANMRWLRRGRRHSFDEALMATGLTPALFARVASAGGYGPEDSFTDLDVTAFRAFGEAVALFSDDELLRFTRVLSSTMTRVADAATALFRFDIGSEMERQDLSELEVVQANYEAGELVDLLFEPLRAFLLHELELAVLRSAEAREGVTSDTISTLRLAVGFVDLVGFTPLSDTLDPDVLASFMADFEERAYRVVGGMGGRVVKLIGDEVMFVTPNPDDACTIALALMATFDAQGVTPRGGLAFGEVVARGGDYYGRYVNLAARSVDVAEPGTVLCGPGLVSEAGQHRFGEVDLRLLKGFSLPVPLSRLLP